MLYRIFYIYLSLLSTSIYANDCTLVTNDIDNAIKEHAKSIFGSEYCSNRIVKSNDDVTLVVYIISGACHGDSIPAGSCGNHSKSYLIVKMNNKIIEPVSVGEGGRNFVREIALSGSEIIMSGVEHTNQDPRCCPSKPYVEKYTISNGNLIRGKMVSTNISASPEDIMPAPHVKEYVESPNLFAVDTRNEVSFFWPLDLQISLEVNPSIFKDEEPFLTVHQAKTRIAQNPNNPSAYFELIRALHNENIVESNRPYNQKINSLYKFNSKHNKLSGKEYVEWGNAVSKLEGPIASIPILEQGINKSSSDEETLKIARFLSSQYLLAASMSLMPPGIYSAVINAKGVDDFIIKFNEIPIANSGKNNNYQKNTARDFLNKAENTAYNSIQSPKAKAFDYTNYSLISFMATGLRNTIDNKSSDIDPIMMFKSPYLETAFNMKKDVPKVEAIKSLRNLMVAIFNAKKGNVDRASFRRMFNSEKTKLESMSHLPSASAEVFDALAVFYFNTGSKNKNKAQKMSIRALTKNPSMKNAFVIRMSRLAQNKNWHEAINIAEKRVKKDQLAESFKIAACTHAYNNNFEKAKKLASDGLFLAKDSMENSSEQTSLIIILATLKIKNGNIKGGVKDLLQIYKRGERHEVLMYNLAAGLYLEGKYRESYNILSESYPKSKQVYTKQLSYASGDLKLKLSKLIKTSSVVHTNVADWHLADLNSRPKKCIRNPLANIYEARKAGLVVKEIVPGVFSMELDNVYMFVADSKQKCEKMLSLIH